MEPRLNRLLRKTLSPNDLGDTGSHQAGIYVPRDMVDHFPTLDESKLNPDVWLDVKDRHGRVWRWRFVHYNNARFGTGTRDEYRLTRTGGFLKDQMAKAGDDLELGLDAGTRCSAHVRPAAETVGESVLVLRTSGSWRSIAI